MNILITGATGFLGNVVSTQLLERGHTLTLMGRDFSRVRNLLYMGAAPLRLDLRDRDGVQAACAGMDMVCHLGALSSRWGPRRDFWEVNVEGTRNVLEGCLEHKVKRLIYASTPGVTFDGHDHFEVNEDAPYASRFVSVYSETKKVAEEMVLGARALLEVGVLRLKALYGPGDRALLPRLLEAAREGRLVQLGNGQNRLDFTYIDDAALAVVLALEHAAPFPVRPVWHITGGEHVRVWDVIYRILEHQGIPRKLPKIPLELALLTATALEGLSRITGKEPALGRYITLLLARNQTYDIGKARRELGYAPQVPFEEGLRRTLAKLER